jgi:hypothetical protein
MCLCAHARVVGQPCGRPEILVPHGTHTRRRTPAPQHMHTHAQARRHRHRHRHGHGHGLAREIRAGLAAGGRESRTSAGACERACGRACHAAHRSWSSSPCFVARPTLRSSTCKEGGGGAGKGGGRGVGPPRGRGTKVSLQTGLRMASRIQLRSSSPARTGRKRLWPRSYLATLLSGNASGHAPISPCSIPTMLLSGHTSI